MRLARPEFCTGTAIVCTIGALGAGAEDTSALALAYAMFLVLAVHLATQYVSEYFDYEADCANHSASGAVTGGSRVLQEGHLPRHAALVAAGWVAALVLAAQAVIVVATPAGEGRYRSMVPLAFAGMLLGYGYTAPPLRLQYRAMGELTIALVVNVLVPCTGYASQSGHACWHAWTDSPQLAVLITLMFCQQTVRALIMNLPDIQADVAVGKITLASRLGLRVVAWLYTGVQVGVLCAAAAAACLQLLPLHLAGVVAAAAPLALYVGLRLLAMGRVWDKSGRGSDLPVLASIHMDGSMLLLLVSMAAHRAISQL